MNLNKEQNNQIKEISKLANKMSYDKTLQTDDIEKLRVEANKAIKLLSSTPKFFKRLK